VPPLCSMRNHFLGLMGGIIGADTLDLNVPEIKKFSDAFDEWNSGVRNPDGHISLETQKHMLYLWAKEEYELIQTTEVKNKFYSTWFSLYQGMTYGQVIAKSCMILPHVRLTQYLDIDPNWKQPQDFIHVPTPPHGSSNEVSHNNRMIYKHNWNAYEGIAQRCDKLADLFWWAQRNTSKEVRAEELDNWLSQTPKEVYPILHAALLEFFGLSQDVQQGGTK
jgi:hypothetical protein